MPLDINNDTNSEVAALKSQIFILLVALVVVTGSLAGCLYRQDSMLNKQCTQLESTIPMINQTQASVNSFVGKLVDYGQRHPDFLPLLTKYGISSQPGVPRK